MTLTATPPLPVCKSCRAMIKAWLAREWTNGKDQKMDSPSWDGGMWDENMLAMG